MDTSFQKLTPPWLNVSRETFEKLEAYYAFLLKWQKKINLISPKSIDSSWERHFLDSAQLFKHLPSSAKKLLDLGSGAGFPGLVLAIMGVPEVHLVESDQRKCSFLKNVSRETSTSVTIHNMRIEDFQGAYPDKGFDVVTARALAPLDQLLTYALPFLTTSSICLFLKTHNIEEELTFLKKRWNINFEKIQSLTDKNGCILKIENVSRETF